MVAIHPDYAPEITDSPAGNRVGTFWSNPTPNARLSSPLTPIPIRENTPPTTTTAPECRILPDGTGGAAITDAFTYSGLGVSVSGLTLNTVHSTNLELYRSGNINVQGRPFTWPTESSLNRWKFRPPVFNESLAPFGNTSGLNRIGNSLGSVGTRVAVLGMGWETYRWSQGQISDQRYGYNMSVTGIATGVSFYNPLAGALIGV